MTRWPDSKDEDDDDFAEPLDDEDDEPTVPCPHCRREIYEDAERCPHCEQFISREDRPAERKPWWIVLGVIVCLYVVWRWMF
jgi:hypothetical protein